MKRSIWFERPTHEWEEGMPIGNGRLGAMILGNVQEEKIDLNEDSIWYGGPKDRINPNAKASLAEIRNLLFEGQIAKAQSLARMAMTSTPQYINPYVPSGYAWLFFEGHQGGYNAYKRVLDLDEAIVQIDYTCQDKHYTREYLASAVDGVIAIQLGCDTPQGLSFSVNLNRRPYEFATFAIGTQMIALEGECGKEGITFTTVMGATSPDGAIQTIGNFLKVEGATEATLYIATETSFRESAHQTVAIDRVRQALTKGYIQIKEAHIKDYQRLNQRNALILETKDIQLPTEEWLAKCRGEELANGLMELIYAFGKYLLIASSRRGTLPSNLQGIWNQSHTPSWESNYTININTQMNYWPAEVCGLSECHEPLFDFVERLCENGKKVAQEIYGCRGSVAHHISNLWADAAPGGILAASPYWPMGLAWLSLHLYEHYLFTKDQHFLRERCYPVIKEVATFFIDYLVLSPEGYLVTGPSVSPENSYHTVNGEVGALCMGPTMDTQIIREVFEAVKVAEQTLGYEEGLRGEIQRIKQLLPPTQIGKYGQVMEWYQDYEEAEPGHRHMSPLFGLHPGSQITKSKTPELFEAAKVTLRRRLEHGGGHTGWSKAWLISFYARLLDGEQAYEHLKGFLRTCVRKSLLDIHPPFQIDGNFGACAAISEMIIQSHEGFIRLLPALPKAWGTGSMTGVCTRGGFVVDLAWTDGIITKLRVHSKCGEVLQLQGMTPVCVLDENKQEIPVIKEADGTITLATQAQMSYDFVI